CRRADDGAGFRLSVLVVELFRQPEIGDFGKQRQEARGKRQEERSSFFWLVTCLLPLSSCLLQQHIRRLEIPMDDAGLVSYLHGSGERRRQDGSGTRRQRCRLEQSIQRAALDIFEAHVWFAIVLADLVYLNDSGMSELGQRLGLSLESLPLRAAAGTGVQDHLQGDEAIQSRLPGEIHDAHAAATQFALDRVAG